MVPPMVVLGQISFLFLQKLLMGSIYIFYSIALKVG